MVSVKKCSTCDGQTFGLRVYHEYVAWAMKSGFKWVRYSRRRDMLTVWNLKTPNYHQCVSSAECADRFERWYNWMRR